MPLAVQNGQFFCQRNMLLAKRCERLLNSLLFTSHFTHSLPDSAPLTHQKRVRVISVTVHQTQSLKETKWNYKWILHKDFGMFKTDKRSLHVAALQSAITTISSSVSVHEKHMKNTQQ